MAILHPMMDDLAKAPEDWKLRGVLADWAEDNGQPELAACLRWMAQNQKRPYHGKSQGGTWFNADTIDPDLGDPASDIPGAVYQHLEGGAEVANHKAYSSLRAAEEAFQVAWMKARASGWDPNVGSS